MAAVKRLFLQEAQPFNRYSLDILGISYIQEMTYIYRISCTFWATNELKKFHSKYATYLVKIVLTILS